MLSNKVFAAALIAAVFAAVAASAQTPDDTPVERPAGSKPDMGFKKEIDIDVKEKPLAAVVDYIRSITGENIVLGKNKDGKPISEAPEMRVTIKLEGVYWKTALRLVAEAARCQIDVIDEKVFMVYHRRSSRWCSRTPTCASWSTRSPA